MWKFKESNKKERAAYNLQGTQESSKRGKEKANYPLGRLNTTEEKKSSIWCVCLFFFSAMFFAYISICYMNADPTEQ